MVDFWVDGLTRTQNIELVKGAMVHHSADLGSGRTGDYDGNNRLLRIRVADTGRTTISNLTLNSDDRAAIDQVLRHTGRVTN